MRAIPWPLIAAIVVVVTANAWQLRDFIIISRNMKKKRLEGGKGQDMDVEKYPISIRHFTKDYGGGKGVFDATLSVRRGEVYGYLGPNGAGKSTTMRHLMGFNKPQSGAVRIEDMECWQEQKKIQAQVGYLPGEIAFPDDMTGTAYLRLIAKMRGMKDFSYAECLLQRFELNPNMKIKRMSKGMKQKIGIVAAFMHDPDILLLDEPTSGLDPLMQSRFIELIQEEKRRGKTILLSSHIFDEVEKTCDRVGIIRNGKLIQEITAEELRHTQSATYQIEFSDTSSLELAKQAYPQAEVQEPQNRIVVSIANGEINRLIGVLSQCRVHLLREERHTLEEYFMRFYGGNGNV